MVLLSQSHTSRLASIHRHQLVQNHLSLVMSVVIAAGMAMQMVDVMGMGMGMGMGMVTVMVDDVKEMGWGGDSRSDGDRGWRMELK